MAETWFCVYALLGRLLYGMHEYDHWNVILEIVGRPMTGKSLLAHLFAKVHTNAIIFSNNVKEFERSLSDMSKASMWVVDDLGPESSSPVWKSLAYGLNEHTPEGHGLIVRNHPIDVDAEDPGHCFIVPVRFDWKGSNYDNTLPARLNAELPAIVYKCALCYLNLCKHTNGEDIWNALPSYFHAQRKRRTQDVNK
jgi:hypothetical protein